MTGPLVLALVAPLAGAVLVAAFADVPGQRRFLVTLVCLGALGGAGWALIRTVGGSVTAWRGFDVDPWRGMLVAGSLLAVACALSRAEEGERSAARQAAVFAAGAAGIAPLLIGGAHLAAVTLLVSTVGFAVASLALAVSSESKHRARRALVALIASDVLALVGLGAALSRGVVFPPRPSTMAGAFLLAAAVIRIGLVPLAWAPEDADRAHPALGLLWLGPVRAQGMLLLVFSLGAGRGLAYAVVACGVATAVFATLRAAKDLSALPAVQAIGGIAVAGFALGGSVATWGALLLVAASFLAWPLWSTAHGWAAAARQTLGVMPTGAALAGTVLIAGAALEGGTTRPILLLYAIPLLAAALAMGGAAAAVPAPAPSRTRSGPGWLTGIVAAVAAAAALTIAAVPARATSGLVFPAARSIGAGRLLGVGDAPGIPDDLAVVVLIAGLLAFAVGPGRIGEGGASGHPSHDGASRRLLAWWAAPGRATADGVAATTEGPERVWSLAAAVLGAAALGLAVRIFLAAAGRGFL